MKLIRIVGFGAVVLGLLFGSAQATEQTFAKPKAGPFRIDWCLQFGSQCGKPAADHFCQSKGFVQSIDNQEDVDIGAATPTIVQGTGQVCNAPQCDGFIYVTCTKPDLPPPPMPVPPPPPGGVGGGDGADSQTYMKPKIGGYRLNFCQTKGIGCGQDAADAFCDGKGFDDAADYQQSGPVPPGAKPTRFIGNGKLCKGPGCYAFTSITCENQP